jgi:hypothetical protein
VSCQRPCSFVRVSCHSCGLTFVDRNLEKPADINPFDILFSLTVPTDACFCSRQRLDKSVSLQVSDQLERCQQELQELEEKYRCVARAYPTSPAISGRTSSASELKHCPLLHVRALYQGEEERIGGSVSACAKFDPDDGKL